MIVYAPRAVDDLIALRDHYERKKRPEAILALAAALTEAERRIDQDPYGGLPAPRPYPRLTGRDRFWIKADRYWIAYDPRKPSVILAVFFDQSDIPRRF